ncbi:MAG: Hint domain-containing protein [Pseudomonadota bacterium]
MADTLLGGIAINEILADPTGTNNFDTDGNGFARGRDEYVELVNTSSSAIDISGVELWDAVRDNWFTFPPGTVLQPGATAVVVRDVQNGGSLPPVAGDNLAFDAAFANGVFNNNGDNIVVYDPANDEYIQATYNGDSLDDPTANPPNTYQGFSTTATRVGDGEDFGSDQDGFAIQRFGDEFFNNGTPTPGAANVCFSAGTRIATPDGFRLVENLRPGDRICTRRSGPQPILWIFSREISHVDLLANPNLRPVRLPGQERLTVSRHHRVLITGKIAKRMFGEDEVLVPAKDLIGYDGCTIDTDIRSLRYFHILLDEHHILNANGTAAESLYLGREGLHAMSASARNELEQIFPGIANAESFVPPELCRTSVSGARAQNLARRHASNRRSLLTPF